MLDLDVIWQRHKDDPDPTRRDVHDLIAEIHALRAVCNHIIAEPKRAKELAKHARDGFPGQGA